MLKLLSTAVLLLVIGYICGRYLSGSATIAVMIFVTLASLAYAGS